MRRRLGRRWLKKNRKKTFTKLQHEKHFSFVNRNFNFRKWKKLFTEWHFLPEFFEHSNIQCRFFLFIFNPCEWISFYLCGRFAEFLFWCVRFYSHPFHSNLLYGDGGGGGSFLFVKFSFLLLLLLTFFLSLSNLFLFIFYFRSVEWLDLEPIKVNVYIRWMNDIERSNEKMRWERVSERMAWKVMIIVNNRMRFSEQE